jgi:hypothetical protein
VQTQPRPMPRRRLPVPVSSTQAQPPTDNVAVAINPATRGIETPTVVFDAIPKPFRHDSPPLTTHERYFGRAVLPMELIARHSIGIGESGSGKTTTFLMPLLAAALMYGSDAPGSVMPAAGCLVIDPKFELKDLIETELRRVGQISRLMVITNNANLRLRFREGLESLDVDDYMKLAHSVVGGAWTNQYNEWIQRSQIFISDMTRAAVAMHPFVPEGSNLFAELIVQYFPKRFLKECRGELFLALQILLDSCRVRHSMLRTVCLGLESMLEEHRLDPSLSDCLNIYVGDAEEKAAQFQYICQSIELFFGVVNAREIRALIDFSPLAVAGPQYHNIAELLGSGRIVLFSPPVKGEAATSCAGPCLESAIFPACF